RRRPDGEVPVRPAGSHTGLGIETLRAAELPGVQPHPGLLTARHVSDIAFVLPVHDVLGGLPLADGILRALREPQLAAALVVADEVELREAGLPAGDDLRQRPLLTRATRCRRRGR